jgi:recombinational DNA repair protein RecT
VPYKDTAQFQIMYEGVIQLCIRSGQYQRIHDTEVYQDELKSYNPITGEVLFRELTEYKMRPKHDINDVAGFYVCFKLLKGFEASLYMTKEEVLAHAERYSKAYQYDLRSGKKLCPWSTDPIAMGRKTVILGLLKRYGIMSVEMQDAVAKDAENEYETVKPVESKTIPTDKAARVKFGSKAKPAEDEQTVKDATEPETQEPGTEVEEDEAKDGLDPNAMPEDWDDDNSDPFGSDAQENQDSTPKEDSNEKSSMTGTATGEHPPYVCTKCKDSKIIMKKQPGKSGEHPFCMSCFSFKNVAANK